MRPPAKRVLSPNQMTTGLLMPGWKRLENTRDLKSAQTTICEGRHSDLARNPEGTKTRKQGYGIDGLITHHRPPPPSSTPNWALGPAHQHVCGR